MKLRIIALTLLCAGLGGLTTPNSATAQIGSFSDVYLSGDGTNPFVRFSQPDFNHHFISGLDDSLGIFVEDGYKFEIFKDAADDSLIVDGDGVSTVDLNVDGEVAIVSESVFPLKLTDPATLQSFGITTLNANQSNSFGGGIGFRTDSSPYPLWVYDETPSQTLSLSPNGVSIGKFVADAPFHVFGNGGTAFPEARILVENDLGSVALREMFSLVNNGGSRFTMENTDSGDKWAFASDSAGRFTFSLDGTGGPEFAVFQDGRVTMGPGNSNNFDLRANGNLIITGTLSQSSDRNLKRAFKEVDDNNVLEQIAKMPVTTWQFKKDEESVRHMGPTSQDFHAAFGLGINDRTIAPVDGVGVSLAGIKALDSKVNKLAKSQSRIS